MQPDRLDHLGAEVIGEPGAAGLLVVAIDAANRQVFILAFEQVPHVVQERGDDERLRRVLLLGELGGLECMLGLRHVLAVIGRLAPACE